MNVYRGMVTAAILRSIAKHPWFSAAMLVATLGLVTAAVIASGIAPINASSGHWPITNAVLDFAKVRSVKLHAWRIDVPPLDDGALVLRGATHYEIGCAPCHGAPRGPVPPVMEAMTPHPPTLIPLIDRWRPKELFYIIKHGIKFTGMPGWADLARDDEAWAMVAFLRRAPGLDDAGYRALAYEPANDGDGAPPIVTNLCARCHGRDGRGRGGAFPRLAGQQSEYLHQSLRAFAAAKRRSATMRMVAGMLRGDDMQTASAYYASLAAPPLETMGVETTRRGESIARRGIAERDIPPCVECHGPRAGARNPGYPDLAGQDIDFLRTQLRLLQQRTRGGTGYENLMHAFVNRVHGDDVDAVTAYYASLAR